LCAARAFAFPSWSGRALKKLAEVSEPKPGGIDVHAVDSQRHNAIGYGTAEILELVPMGKQHCYWGAITHALSR
jgi:hypothetical protein